MLADLESGWTQAVQARLRDSISLGSQMGKLFRNASTMYSDVIFVVASKPIHAHQIVLRLRKTQWDIIKDLETGKIQCEHDKKTNTYTISSDSGITDKDLENALLYLYTAEDAYSAGFFSFCKKHQLTHSLAEPLETGFAAVFEDDFDEEYAF
jgi:hypothetical protein